MVSNRIHTAYQALELFEWDGEGVPRYLVYLTLPIRPSIVIIRDT